MRTMISQDCPDQHNSWPCIHAKSTLNKEMTFGFLRIWIAIHEFSHFPRGRSVPEGTVIFDSRLFQNCSLCSHLPIDEPERENH